MSDLSLPRLPNKGRPTSGQKAAFAAALDAWCARVLEINSTLDFRISSRGWCYILEEHGLLKGEFDAAQRLINDCRKSGLLPCDICAEDERRSADGDEPVDDADIRNEADRAFRILRSWHEDYRPTSFWDAVSVYVEMAVEKVDLKELFGPICAESHVRIGNRAGWCDINSRVAQMSRFKYWEERGKQCVLLYCGDHDPGGLHISDFIPSNFADLSKAADWSPDNLIVERFGLDFGFIEAQGLTWIDNLETSAGGYRRRWIYYRLAEREGRAA